MKLADATWTDLRDADTRLALLPVGSTEGHGPHAPLGTDTLNAETVAAAGAERYEDEHGVPVVVGPPMTVGISKEHRAFDGTLWVSPDTFRSYVRETVESLAHHGFDRVVLVNGHGGNVDALREVSARAHPGWNRLHRTVHVVRFGGRAQQRDGPRWPAGNGDAAPH
jgi:Uncharacterized protein, putative amidase